MDELFQRSVLRLPLAVVAHIGKMAAVFQTAQ